MHQCILALSYSLCACLYVKRRNSRASNAPKKRVVAWFPGTMILPRNDILHLSGDAKALSVNYYPQNGPQQAVGPAINFVQDPLY